MVQIVEQSHDEKLKMYLKLSKRELAEMLITCNEFIQNLKPQIATYPSVLGSCNHEMIWVQNPTIEGAHFQCRKCGHPNSGGITTITSSAQFKLYK